MRRGEGKKECNRCFLSRKALCSAETIREKICGSPNGAQAKARWAIAALAAALLSGETSCPRRSKPPLKGEAAAKRTEGFNHTEFGNFNLWFPNSSIEPAVASGTGHCPAAAPGHQSAGNPADSETLAALIYGGQWSSIGYAAAGGAGNACRTNFGGGLGEREAKRNLPQPTGSAAQ